MDRLNLSHLRTLSTTHSFGREVIYLPRTGSTNDVIKESARQGAPEGAVAVTDEQTAGKGRLGRRWLAPANTCILCSILFRPKLAPTQTQRLTMLCALAAVDAIEKTAGLHVWLKWPNDLVVQSQGWKKLGGILTETGIAGEQVAFAIVGIGINVNVERQALPALDPNATSILAESGQLTERAALLATLLAGVEQRYAALQAGENPHQEWASRLATLGLQVEASTAQETLTGMAESVDEDGALLLRAPDGTLHRLVVGDVTLKQSS
ncbi:MAG: biotin--[acetyl-CoA-carboxylase] ligase [Anaerolineae bacterium]|nr:biotin--[acetyl-CoA-carboxylase] ligase [Anaerolineae bacterium]